MSERELTAKPGGTPAIADDEVDLLEYAFVIWRHRRLVGGLCLAALLAMFGYTVTRPRIYEAAATLISPKEGGGSGLLGGLAVSTLLQQVPSISIPSLTPNRDMILSVL